MRPRPTDQSGVLLLALATLAALVLGVVRLGHDSLWFDEIFSVEFAHLSWRHFFHGVVQDQANMSLYYVLLRLWRPFGQHEADVRALSVVSAVATVPVFFALGSKLLGRRVAGVGSVLLVVNTFFLEWAREARGYSLVLLLVTASSLLFLEALEHPSWQRWLAYGAVSGIAMYAHFFAAFVLVAQAVVVASRHRDLHRTMLGGFAVAAVLTAPLASLLLTHDNGQIAWVSRPHLRTVGVVMREMVGGSSTLLAAYFVLCAAGLMPILRVLLVSGIRRRPPRSFSAGCPGTPTEEGWRDAVCGRVESLLFLLTWLVVPVAGSWVLSQLKPMFMSHYLIVVLPPLTLLAASGISQLAAGWARALSFVTIVALALATLVPFYSHRQKENWRDAARFVIHDSRPGDGIVFYIPSVRLAFEYYVDAQDAANREPRVIFPPGRWRGTNFLPVRERGRAVADRGWAEFGRRDVTDMLTTLGIVQPGRLWVVVAHEHAASTPSVSVRELEQTLQRWYPAGVGSRDFTGVRVDLFARR